MRALLFLTLLLTPLAAAYAQLDYQPGPTDYRQSYMIEPRYRAMVQEAYKKQADNEKFDFMRFRGYYARSRAYDPVGKAVLEKLNNLAYQALYAVSEDDRERAFLDFRAMVDQHMGNVEAVALALSLSRQNPKFGKTAFYQWMRDGLIDAVVISGDGRSLYGAYDIITAGEEAILFNRIGVERLKTTSAREHKIYYNMHDVEDLKTGRLRTVFVNTSIPMKYLDALAEERRLNYTIDIQKQ